MLRAGISPCRRTSEVISSLMMRPEMILGTMVYSSFNHLTRRLAWEYFTEMYLSLYSSAQTVSPKIFNVRSTVIFTLKTILYQMSTGVNFRMHLLLAESFTKLQLCEWKKWQTLTSFRSQFNLYIPFAFNLTFNTKKVKVRYCTTRTMSHNMVC